MANVLKWYWWRFNGYGYFWGMMAGILSAMFVPELATLLHYQVANTLYLFPDHPRLFRDRLPARHAAHEAGGRRHAQAVLQNRESLGRLGSRSANR